MKYIKDALVYSGPMSDIYKATDPEGNTVALKIVDLDFVQKPHDFRKEVEILKKLKSDGVAKYIDSYTIGDDMYLVMPYYAVDMVGLMTHYCKKRTKFDLSDPLNNITVCKNEIPTRKISNLVKSLVSTIDYIHIQRIIHRDLKPANIMFRGLEDLENPVIVDFGISYDLNGANPEEPPNEKVTDIGTGYYKAPELCFGVSDYGPEVDYWSLGIIISYLYSTNCHPCNYVAPSSNERELQPELNDFVLIQGNFEAFGTPTITDKHSELYWPKLADPDYHFVKFQYKPHERKPTQQLLPRCEDMEIHEIFDNLTRYDKRELMKLD